MKKTKTKSKKKAKVDFGNPSIQKKFDKMIEENREMLRKSKVDVSKLKITFEI